jgi:hypothetical protein
MLAGVFIGEVHGIARELDTAGLLALAEVGVVLACRDMYILVSLHSCANLPFNNGTGRCHIRQISHKRSELMLS